MRHWGRAASLALSLVASAVQAGEPEQFFASIYLDAKKIGQVHVRLSRGDDGEIEELRARASVSMLGIKLYEFGQDVHHVWQDGELQRMEGRSDDDGTIYEVQLNREPADYQGARNDDAVSLPLEAFPNSLWHYGIVEHPLLFNEVNLDLMKVQIAEADATIELHGKKIATRRATFSGDFDAVVWFDEAKDFQQGEYQLNGRKIRVERDP